LFLQSTAGDHRISIPCFLTIITELIEFSFFIIFNTPRIIIFELFRRFGEFDFSIPV
jgi:hypothetical protein